MTITSQVKSLGAAPSGPNLQAAHVADSIAFEAEANRVAAAVDPEHNANGTHKTVNATAVVAPSMTLGGIERTEWPAAGGTASGLNDVLANGATGSLPAGATKFEVQDDTGGIVLTIDKATGAASNKAGNFMTDSNVNPKAHAQSVSLTAASSGSTGLTFADNANLDMGTNNFTPAVKVALPDYTPSAEKILFHKHDGTNGIILSLLTTGIARLTINASTYDSTVAIPATDGVAMLLFPVVVRETATTAGSVTFYFGGKQLGDAVAITAGAPTSVDNASPLYVMGTSAVRTEGRYYEAYLFNLALSAAEASLFAKNSVAYAHQWAAQAELVTNGSFTGSATGWSLGAGWAYGTNNIVATAAAAAANTTQNIAAFAAGKKFRFSVTVSGYAAGSLRLNPGGFTQLSAISADGVYTFDALLSTGTAPVFYLQVLSTLTATIDDVSCVQIGCVFSSQASGINPTQLKDSSSNKLHGSYPPSGSSLAFPMASGSYEWQTAIAADTTLTSIVPAGFELEKIVFQNSTAGAVSVRLGTTAGGTDVFGLTALNTSATLGGFKTVLCNQGFSLTAAQTLYLSSTDWTGGGTPPSLTFTAFFRRIQ